MFSDKSWFYIKVVKPLIDRPAVEDMNFLERKVYAAEILMKKFIVGWLLFRVAYGFALDILK